MTLWIAALAGLAAVAGILFVIRSRSIPGWARITALTVLGLLACGMLVYGILTLLLVLA